MAANGLMTGAERRGSWVLRAPEVSLGASMSASLRDGEADKLFNPRKLNAQESRRVLYPSCIVASRYWRVLVLSGCLFKSEIGNWGVLVLSGCLFKSEIGNRKSGHEAPPRFCAIGACWCYPVAYLNRKSEIGNRRNLAHLPPRRRWPPRRRATGAVAATL